jgi:PBSX family phage terminase large subunit
MKLTSKQSEALDILEDDTTTELLFGGGAGGGKSALGVYWIVKCCIRYAGIRALIGRSILKTLKETTLNTLFDVLKMQNLYSGIHYKMNFGTNTITFFNGSQIIFKDLFQYPSDPNFDELGSLEITCAFVDEANQITEKCKEILKSRIRYKLDEHKLIPKILYTCNPAKNWTYIQFYKPARENELPNGKKFIQSLATDNIHLSKYYIENLKTLDKVSRERLLYGNWEYDNDPAKLIEYDSIINMFTNEFAQGGLKYISCDVARFGNDNTVILLWDGLRVFKYVIDNGNSIADTAQKIIAFAIEYNIPRSNIVIDEDGVGGGLVDALKGCKGFVNNSRALNNENFINLKSQCYFKLAEYINGNKILFENISIDDKQKLIEELEVVKRKDIDKDGRIAILPKDKVKELINRSPDISDAMMLRMYFELSKSGNLKSKRY